MNYVYKSPLLVSEMVTWVCVATLKKAIPATITKEHILQGFGIRTKRELVGGKTATQNISVK